MIFKFILIIDFALRHDNFSWFFNKRYRILGDATRSNTMLLIELFIVILRCYSVVKAKIKRRCVNVTQTCIHRCAVVASGMGTVYISHSEILLIETRRNTWLIVER